MKVVNKYKEPFDVYIGYGSVWGNPYPVTIGRLECIRKYEVYIRDRLEHEPKLRAELKKLKGKTLGCFCKPRACHGDVLVKLYKEMFGDN